MRCYQDMKDKSSVIGIFSGECADSNITNLNGLDITREVWENTFSSDEYKKGIELGHYIGFLGHPDDPGCQEFQDGCIVMTEGHIDDNGKVYGSFNLINTPVGRIVKSFIDAGVKFGISVRGAGDIINNSVDPDTFVFRGFDLVSFPAFPESIPTFTTIAASSDVEAQKKYKKVCAAVKNNLQSIKSCEAIDIIQEQFGKQSPEYQALEDRKNEIKSSEGDKEVDDDVDEVQDIDVNKQKIEAMTNLYLEAIQANRQLKDEIANLTKTIQHNEVNYRKKLIATERICQDQVLAAQKTHTDLESQVRTLDGKVKTLVTASNMLKTRLEDEKSANLIYLQKITASKQDIASKDEVIASLNQKLSETVASADDMKRSVSNRDSELQNLKKQVKAAKQIAKDYQEAYANLYSQAIGADPSKVRLNSTMSVADIRRSIKASTQISYSDREISSVELYDGDEESVICI